MFRFASCLAVWVMLVNAAQAVTITHGGTTITMDFVSVGNPGNAGELSGGGAQGGQGPDAIVGGVDYSYNIGKYDVTKNQWDAVSGIAGDLLDDSGCWSGDQPVGDISWYEAAMFCNWLTTGDVTQGAYTVNSSGVVTGIDRDSAVSEYGTTYVIPTENEWYKAAYYDGGTSTYYFYPTSSDSVPDGIDSSTDTEFDAVFWDGYCHDSPNTVDNAGVLSPYGTMGQGGNISEWNETAIGSSRGLRGGFWGSSSYIYLLAPHRYHGENPTFEDSSVGFRVASVPEPGSITLLVCGLVAGLIWWRRRK